MIYYRQLHPFEAISFDLDDTLYDNSQHMPVAEAAFLHELQQRYPATAQLARHDWQNHRRASLQTRPQLSNDMGRLRRDILQRVFTSLGFEAEALKRAVDEGYACYYYHRSNLQVEENIHSLLAKLTERYKLVAITNGNVDLKQIGLADYFSHIFKAHVAMPMKPHQAMFDACQSALNIAPQRILHVGDNLHNDIYGAMRAGFQSGWYAHDRHMQINKEPMFLLPNVQLHQLDELLCFDHLNRINVS